MKSTTSKRALSIANLFNILVAIYFFIISTVSLIKLRWYHRLTVHNKWHHFISSSSSYFAFIILLAVALLLAIVFILSISYSNTKIQMSFDHFKRSKTRLHETTRGNCARSLEERPHVAQVRHGPSFMEASSKIIQPRSWSIALQILASLGLVVTLIVWLLNGAEIARDSIEKELTPIFNRYQFFNNRDYISRLVDGIQETNNCCGLHSFTDSRVTRTSGFSSAYYPISCCDKGTYPPSAPTLRYACALEEVTRSGQMNGCVRNIADYYDLISLLIIPVALVCLFVNVTVIAVITINNQPDNINNSVELAANGKFEQLDPNKS